VEFTVNDHFSTVSSVASVILFCALYKEYMEDMALVFGFQFVDCSTVFFSHNVFITRYIGYAIKYFLIASFRNI